VFSQAITESPKKIEKPQKPSIQLYKIVTVDRDTTFVDTTLSIKKAYRFNYLRNDNFELLPFANVGQAYNKLAYSFNDFHLQPKFAAQSRHSSYLGVDNINYYSVPTPLSELYFKTAFRQGQQLNSFFTVNTSRQFNISLGYHGVRSLGQFQNALTSTRNFRMSTNYHTKNNRYSIRAHMVLHDIINQENGGLTENSILLFEAGDSEFDDRGRLDVNFEDATNRLLGRRFYTNQEYQLIRKADSLQGTSLTLGNTIGYEEKTYEYNQDTPFEGFGESLVASNLSRRTTLKDFKANTSIALNSAVLGKLSAFAGYSNYSYGYNSVLEQDNLIISDRLKGSLVSVGASYAKQYRGLRFFGKGAVNVTGNFSANYLKGEVSFRFNEDNVVRTSAKVHSVAPNFNFLLQQSDYLNYNWQNDFENVKTQQLQLELKSKKIANISVTYSGIDDYTYFTIVSNDSTPTPQQFEERIDYLKIRVDKEIRYGSFVLMNTLLFQQVLSGDSVFNVPNFVTRQSVYYQDEWFKKAMFLQTGIHFKYFSSYHANGYDPVLAEFYVQNNQKIGAFPLVSLFFNAKIRQTRIFLEYEHFNQLFNNTNNQFSAPGYPYRDAAIRFGLVWNFFL